MQPDEIVFTQTQSQNANSPIWDDIEIVESLSIEPVVWGRLIQKTIKVKSLGLKMGYRISIEDSTKSAKILELNRECYTVGKTATNDIQLTGFPIQYLDKMSKCHFRIEKDTSQENSPVFIEDLSYNGTFINGKLIGFQKKQILLNDDDISIVHLKLITFTYKTTAQNTSKHFPRNVTTNYHIGDVLGKGACGEVRIAYDRSCTKYAIKHIHKKPPLSNIPINTARIMNEVKIMKFLNHPCVIKMHDIIDDDNSMVIVLELMKGGDLLNRILKKKYLSEKMAKLYFIQMCHAVKYLHDNNITHRDLKPDNILLNDHEDETLLKVSDFGLSKDNTSLRSMCGTLMYVAPEILTTAGGQERYTNKVDVWGLGIVLFTCLSGSLPFSEQYGSSIEHQIKSGTFSFRGSAWRDVSVEAKTLILKMLTVNPQHRPSIKEILKNRWLQDVDVIKKAEQIMKISLKNMYKERENFKYPAPKRRRVELD